MKRYKTIPKEKSPEGKQMYQTVRYPEIPRSFEDTYVYTTIGDRFDTLAQTILWRFFIMVGYS